MDYNVELAIKQTIPRVEKLEEKVKQLEDRLENLIKQLKEEDMLAQQVKDPSLH